MSILKRLGIVIGKGKKGKAAIVFESLYPSFLTISYIKPSEYVDNYWTAYNNSPLKNKNINGKIFEYILATLFVREGIMPLYLNAKVAFVPNVNYDFIFYTEEKGPVCISAKTSLRERYKQAALEGIVLKNVHRKAFSVLVTLDLKEAMGVKEKLENGDIIGFDKVIIAFYKEFDDLINEIKAFKAIEPPTVKVIQSNQIITASKLAL